MALALALKEYESNVADGLGTFTFTVVTPGLYEMYCQSSVLPPSGLSIVLKHNGSTVATSSAPSAAQQNIQINATNIHCVASDTLSVVITSSNANDLMLNTLKSIMVVTRSPI